MTNLSHMLPFSRYCDVCERERSSDLVQRHDNCWRYECDDCQRDIESQMQAALENALDDLTHVASIAREAAE